MDQFLYGVLATRHNGVLGPIATVLGYLMNGIFTVLNSIGIPNIGLSIIIFTIIIYLVMTPLTVKQQKFSKLSARMNPELSAVREKYKGRSDSASMAAMQEETNAVYAKYGVSPMGSCVQLAIQMPILFALYRVIYAIPAYVGQVRDAFFPLVDSIVAYDNTHAQGKVSEFLQGLSTSAQYSKQFNNDNFLPAMGDYVASTVDKAANITNYAANTYVDCLNRMSSGAWDSFLTKFGPLSANAVETRDALFTYNKFLGLNIANSPSFSILDAFGVEKFSQIFSNMGNANWLVFFGALAIPILAAFTQWLNIALMPQMRGADASQDSMMASMRTMNLMMPIMSAVFCFSLPSGMGIYWIAGAVVRLVQQVVINKHIDKMNVDDIIEKNKEKYEQKLEKANAAVKNINAEAVRKTRNIGRSSLGTIDKEKEEKLLKARDYFEKNAEPDGIASRALLVKRYNEKGESGS